VPLSVLERYLPVARALAAQQLLEGVAAERGTRALSPLAVDAALARAAGPVEDQANKVARLCASAHVEGVCALRAALGRETGMDDRELDIACAIALERHQKVAAGHEFPAVTH
jgi:hypothetical protein